MPLFIHDFRKLFNYLVILFSLFSCLGHSSQSPFSHYQQGTLTLKDGSVLNTYLAITRQEQVRGLSRTQPNQFSENEAMLFFNQTDKVRNFWMPETHFNLDLFYLNEDYFVLDIDRNIPHFKSRTPEEDVPRGSHVFCRHVLEIKASSPLAKKIKIGDQLKWKPKSLEQRE